jgi:bacteriocin-like protein
MEKIMSKSSCATPTTELVRELRDDELQEVSGGYTFNNVMVESIVAPRDLNSGHTVGLVAPPHAPL